MLTFPNAKINIGLNIVERRTDGYHNIETVFYPIALCDALEVLAGEKKTDYSFISMGIPVDSSVDNNLITKAFYLLKKDFEMPPIEVFFRKIIPFGAGLGGGSADAAFMLKTLNQLFNLQLSLLELQQYAVRLGADCSFFIENKAVFATGIGNSFSDINLSLKGYYIVLIKPTINVSTVQAYAGVSPQKPSVSLFDAVQNMPITDWKNVVKNDFEKNVFGVYPVIEKIKNDLYAHGALYASMSGSGSSVYGIFDKEVNVKEFFPDCFVWNGYLE
jgi:4-diphosphocytidyl-2-C-methyl-D-erythritol kinase